MIWEKSGLALQARRASSNREGVFAGLSVQGRGVNE